MDDLLALLFLCTLFALFSGVGHLLQKIVKED